MAEIKFHYIKSADYQEIPCHGAFGGVVPTGDRIFLALYSERPPIPRVIYQELDERGALTEELSEKRETKDGVVRTVHVGAFVDIAEATSLRDWLTSRIGELERTRDGHTGTSS